MDAMDVANAQGVTLGLMIEPRWGIEILGFLDLQSLFRAIFLIAFVVFEGELIDQRIKSGWISLRIFLASVHVMLLRR